METTVASAPGKVILFGEHAVVYGYPALAAPVSAVRVTVDTIPCDGISAPLIDVPDLGRSIDTATLTENDPLFDALVFPVQLALDACHAAELPFRLVVHSTIPVGGGLGSGAALATALVRTVAHLSDHDLSDDTVNALVYEVEKRHHGTPSGIDNTVIVYEKPVYFVRGRPLELLHVAQPFTLLVADSGQSSPTRLTVADVRRLREAEPARVEAILADIGQIAQQARHAIESGQFDLLGPLMDANHALLAELTVSSPELDALCAAARAAGAGGAKLSGGGRGGNIIALVDDDCAPQVETALLRAGASRVLRTTIA